MDSFVETGGSTRANHRAVVWHRYGLLAYWLLFAVRTLDWARNPGFVADPANAPYPWAGVVATWDLLALEVSLVGWFLGPRPIHRPRRGRLGAALVLYAGLTAFSVVTFATDMAGYYYVPGQFHLVTLVGLLILALVRATRAVVLFSCEHRRASSITYVETAERSEHPVARQHPVASVRHREPV